MKKVKSNLCPIGLDVFTRFSDNLSGFCYWVIKDLDYAGEDFSGNTPEEIEIMTEGGLKFDEKQMAAFGSTVNQIFEGIFIMYLLHENIHDPQIALEVEVYDGEVWQVGGEFAKRFILKNKIAYV